MAQPTRARQDLRLDVLRKIDPTSEPKSSACTAAGTTTTLVDDALAPAAQSEDFVGDWIYIRSQIKTDSTSLVNEATDVTAAQTTIDVDDGTDFDDSVSQYIQIDDEIMGPITDETTSTLTLTRGAQGTTAATHLDNAVIYIVTGPPIGEIRRVTNVDFSGTTSTLTVAPAFTIAPVDTQEYERHRKVRPSIINDRLDVTLGLIRQNVLLPVTLVVDGNMETSGVGSWTAANAALVKDTTYVRRGRYSLKVTPSAADGGAASAYVYLPGGTECILAADVYITDGDKAKLVLYDATTGADIGTPMESDETGWVHLEGRFTVPATCESVLVKALGQTTGDVIYYDHITLWPVADQGIELPSFLEFVYDVRGLFYIPVGTGVAGTTNVEAYRINEGSPQFYAHYKPEQDDTAVVSARFYVDDRRPSNALWIKGRKPYPAFAGDTEGEKDVDTTQAHKNVVTNMTAASIIDDWALDAIEAEKPQLAENLQVKALMLRNEIAGLIASMTPPKKKIITTPWTRK